MRFNLTRLAAGITGAPQGTYTSDNMSHFSINGGSLNHSVYKNYAVYERMRPQVCLETINAANHTYFNGLASTKVDNPTSFGVINSAANSRQMQAGVKLMF